MTRVVVDARRLLCPLPVIRVQDRVAGLEPGTQVEAICTDPGVLHDIPAWCRINGHQVIDVRDNDGEYVVVLKVSAN